MTLAHTISMRCAFIAAAFFLCASYAHAAVLTNNELVPDSYAEIIGEGFGELSEGSFICFNVNSKCFNKDSFQKFTRFEWMDTKIIFGVPGDIPLSGSLFVYNAGKRAVCVSGRCTVQEGVKELARLSYAVRPLVRSVDPILWERESLVTLKGGGFGDATGSVLFDDLNASVVSWTDRELIVRAPSGSFAKRIVVQSTNRRSTEYPLFSYLDDIQAPKSWSLAGSAPVTIAVIDDGLYLNHPAIKSYVWRNAKEVPGNGKDDDGNGYDDDVYGTNFITNSASVDPNGIHGTLVASIALSVAHAGMTGTQSNVRIMPLVVANAQGVIASSASVIKAIRYAADNGANIINVSFGSGGSIGFVKEFDEAIQYAFDKGAIVVAAAGNDDRLSKDGTDLNVVPQSPVCNNKGRRLLLGVAALDNLDDATNGTRRARWSSYGSNCVQLSAPGMRIPGAIPPQYSADKSVSYDQGSGTSFASPIVSGVAALMKMTFPSMPNWEIMNRIIASSDSASNRVNAYRALSSSSFQPSVGAIEPSVSEPGKKITVVLNDFSAQFGIRLVNERSAVAIDPANIHPLAADTFELLLPVDIDEGVYRIALSLPSTLSSIAGQSELRIRRTAVPVQHSVQPPSLLLADQTTPSPEPPISWLDRERELSLRSAQKPIERLKGRILLQVEEQGQAWYVNPSNGKRYYMKDGTAAFELLRRFGLGIRARDLARISREEQKSVSPNRFAERLKGKILIDVDTRGESWYINPFDGKRYYLKNGPEAYRIMRQLGLGISNTLIRTIPIGY